MKVVVIGGTGHAGSYLVPRLIEAGHEVVSVSRQERSPYNSNAMWDAVQQVQIDRVHAEEQGTFGQQIRELNGDAVIDMICFTPESARHLVEALRGHVQHFLHCGSIWVHGYSVSVPTEETQPRDPFANIKDGTIEEREKSGYGINKAAIESYLLAEARQFGFPATVLHPGHIVGPGWAPVNPLGNFNPQVFDKLARGENVTLPNFGLETCHHVHADDLAQAFMKALGNWSNAVGESFHVVSPSALTYRGFAESMASWFGQPAKLSFIPWREWIKTVSYNDARTSYDLIAHSPNCSIAKAQRLINYQPRYSSLQAVQESVQWLIDIGLFTDDATEFIKSVNVTYGESHGFEKVIGLWLGRDS